MRKSRLKLEETSYYHCMSRVIEQRFIMGEREREYFVNQMRNLAVFSGLRILTYCVMSNHFHILLQVPRREPVSDRLLLERLRAIYPANRVAEVAILLRDYRKAGNHDAADRLKASYTYRMYDISAYFKTLKQVFSQWYNKRNDRRGPLWDQRFKSLLVEGSAHALSTIAAYIDLNPLRAGLVADPSSYRHCGYAAALGGNALAQYGIRAIWPQIGSEASWQRVRCRYRKWLYLQGEESPMGVAGGRRQKRGFSTEDVKSVLEQDGELSSGQLLRCRVRYFSDGVALGSKAFAESLFSCNRDWFGAKRKRGARPIRNGGNLGLVTLRDLRCEPVRLPFG
jgi:REP element-mobilizing transposase RayT